jgi:hypothetical protein
VTSAIGSRFFPSGTSNPGPPRRTPQENATGARRPLSYRSQRGNGNSRQDEEDDMIHLASWVFGSEDVFASVGLWAFLSIGAIALFAVFIPLVTYFDSRRKEREAFYKSEMMRRIAEASGEGSKATLELLREEGRQKQIKTIEGLKIGGLINIAVGVALVIFLRSLLGGAAASPYLCGLIPGMIGVAMLVYVYVMARPVE